tara:strand:- start:553 stop:858 length:306 start_codon:yes stop_codon:yes gene_type:complete
MKNVIIGCVLCLALGVPVMAGDKVRVSYEGEEQRIDVGDIKLTSVCSLKQKIADMYGLKNRDFDLKKLGYKLSEDKTLYAANVRNNNALQIVPVSSGSYQC